MFATFGTVLLSGPYAEDLPVVLLFLLAPVAIVLIAAWVAYTRNKGDRETRGSRAILPREQEEEQG